MSAVERPYKGRCLYCFPDDYTVIDIETNGMGLNMEPIEIGAIRVRGGKRSAVFSTFVRPSRRVEPFITWLTGITDDMVRHAPLPQEALPLFQDFIRDDTLLGYNVHFDVNCLYDAFMREMGFPLINDFVDVLRFSRRYLFFLPDRKQTTVAAYFGLDVSRAHRAFEDCQICDEVYRRLRRLIESADKLG